TDNRTRTVGEVRHAFSKHGGNLGQDGSVAFLFKKTGVLHYPPGLSEDKIIEAALEAGADDVTTDADGSIEVLTAPENFHALVSAMTQHGLKPEHAELAQHAAVSVPVNNDDAQKILALLEALEDVDDVQNVFSNAEFPDELLKRAS
ncbi:MAG: YebC/PmpR family DNA-binding transcriptional regulator, partial [Gammaproteobacteria bacterium]|nr:YebC/PmpR family DNA-binding transcriptional regulator [Gammaproteobacteria bacterium]